MQDMDSPQVISLREKVKAKTARVCVVGLGYVGLPLAVVFANAGYSTIAVDADESKIAHIRQGQPYIRDGFVEITLPTVLETGRLTATVDLESGVQQSDFIILCLPTPIDERKRPDLRIMLDVLGRIRRDLTPGKFIIIESSVYPGFTEEQAKPVLEKSGLAAGLDFGLAYSPERIDFANSKYYVTEINKVVGGVNDICTQVAADLYDSVLHAGVTKVSSPAVAEASKMIENLYRFMNISMVNELAILFEKMSIDTFEVIKAAATKPFGYQAFFPGPGIGGHCIPKDPYYLAFRAQKEHMRLALLSAGAQVDSRMQVHICHGIRQALWKVGKRIEKSKITVLGLAYKAETSEIRRSPAIRVLRCLSRTRAKVTVYDPHVHEIDVKGKAYVSEEALEDALANSDCYLFLVDHKVFRRIDLNFIAAQANPPPLVYDARGMFNGLELATKGICYAALGKPSVFPAGFTASQAGHRIRKGRR